MKIAVASDLHLAPGGANRCTATPGQLLDFFDTLESQADRVVLAGDLFDLDRPRVPGDWQAQLRALRAEQPEVMRRLDAFDWVLGNHDAALARRGVPQERAVLTDRARVLIRHGHQWDMALKKIPGLAAGANFVAGWLQRAEWKGAAGALGQAPLALDRVWNRHERRDRCLRGAQALMAGEDWDVVVCGHSHRLRLVAGPHGLFVNTGSLCLGHLDWALIDTDPARPSVTLWRDDQIFQRAEKRASHWQEIGSI